MKPQDIQIRTEYSSEIIKLIMLGHNDNMNTSSIHILFQERVCSSKRNILRTRQFKIFDVTIANTQLIATYFNTLLLEH